MNSKPDLLLVSDTYYPKVDGVIRFIEEFVKRAKDDFELTLLVPKFEHQKNLPETKTILLETSKIIKPLPTYPSIKISLNNLRKIKRAVKESDIVFIQGPALASFLSIYYARRYHKRAVFYIHVISWELFEKSTSFLLSKFSNLFKKITVWMLNKCDLILLPYLSLKEEMRAEKIKAKMRTASLGIDINRFMPTRNKQESKRKLCLPEKTIIGYVGRISKEKNTLILLNAFKKLNPEKFFLLMVGDGDEEIVKEFKKNKNCLVTGFVDKVEEYLKAMDIFVMPSLVETTSLATLEAMACGLPVISTKIGFMKEYIKRNENGLFFPRSNATMLALKIEKLMKNHSLREKLSQQARKTMAYSFSWERSINRIKRIILRTYHQG